MAKTAKDPEPAEPPPEKPDCGIVMPLAEFDDYPKQHWADVFEILRDAAGDAGFTARMVSDADEVGVIHKTIVQNLYSNPLVICDISGRNPNVMTELGMRLAFDKPTIIVKDFPTKAPFDTSVIEYLLYPRELRFPEIVRFKHLLATKLKATYEKASKDQTFSTFLKQFGSFVVPRLDTKEVSKEDYIIEELKDIKRIFGTYFRGPDLFVPGTLTVGAAPDSVEKEVQKAVVQYICSGVSGNLYSLARSPRRLHMAAKSILAGSNSHVLARVEPIVAIQLLARELVQQLRVAQPPDPSAE
jgi:hypothetical protein